MLLMHRKIATVMKRAAMQKRRRVVITSGSDERSYEGKTSPLTLDEYTLTGDDIDPQDTLTVNVTGRQTFVGSSSNEFDASISSASGIEYEIEKVYGTLCVTDENVDDDLVVNMSCGDSIYSLGEEVMFDIDATNIYAEARTITLTEVDFVALAQSVFENVSSGGRVDTTATYTMTEADILSGSFTNTVTAYLGNIAKTAQAVAEAEEPVSHLTVTLMTTSTPADEYAYAVGETATFELEVINDGNLTITQIAVAFNAPDDRTICTYSIGSLTPGARSVFNDNGLSYTPTVEDAVNGDMILTATATGRTPDPNAPNAPYADVDNGVDPEPVSAGEGAMEVYITETSTPANGTAYTLGETVSYEIVIENAAVSTLSNLSVNAEVEGYESDSIDDSFDVLEIAYEEYATGTYSHTVTEQDILAGGIALYVEASAEDMDGNSIEYTGDITSDVVEIDSSLNVSVSESSTAPANGYALGSTISYSFAITNNGNLTIGSLSATAAVEGYEDLDISANLNKTELAPGETAAGTFTWEVTEQNILSGSIEISIAAAGEDPNGGDVEGSGSIQSVVEDPNPSLSVSASESSTAPAGGYALGSTISYAITIINDGNLTISNVSLAVNIPEDITNVLDKTELAPGETAAGTFTWEVTEGDIVSQSIVIAFTADGENESEDQTNLDSAEVESAVEAANPSLYVSSIEITSEPEDSEGYAAGEYIEFTATVQNDGNVTVSGITAVCELTNNNWTVGSLAPGEESEPLDGEYEVTAEDSENGSVEIEITADGTSDSDEPVNQGYAYISVPVIVREFDLEEAFSSSEAYATSEPANGEAYALEEEIDYYIKIVNSSDVTLRDVVVDDYLTGDKWTIDPLGPGEIKEFTSNYTVTEMDVLTGRVVNEIVISPKDPNGEPFSAAPLEVESFTDAPNPSITMVIDTTSTPANGNTYALGECIEYKFTIRNDGNLTLTNIRYGSELTGDEWEIDGLAPDRYPETEGRHCVDEFDILKGSVTCDAWYRASTPDPDNPTISEYEASTVEDSVDDPVRHLSAACRVTSHPANGNAYALGETVTWQHPVTNDGNLTIYSIRLTANPGGSSWDIKSPRHNYSDNYLAPNEVSDSGVTASYAVTEADILRGYIEIEPEITGAVDVEGTECIVDPGGIQVLTEAPNPELTIENNAQVVEHTHTSGSSHLSYFTMQYDIQNTGNISLDAQLRYSIDGNPINQNSIISLTVNESNTVEIALLLQEYRYITDSSVLTVEVSGLYGNHEEYTAVLQTGINPDVITVEE